MANVNLTLKAGSTEPEELTVSATGLSNLDSVSAGQWNMWDASDGSTVIDGEENGASSDGPGFSITDSANLKVELDPDGAKSGGGNAFDAAGTYKLTLRLIFNDGDDQIWPDEGWVIINLERSS